MHVGLGYIIALILLLYSSISKCRFLPFWMRFWRQKFPSFLVSHNLAFFRQGYRDRFYSDCSIYTWTAGWVAVLCSGKSRSTGRSLVQAHVGQPLVRHFAQCIIGHSHNFSVSLFLIYFWSEGSNICLKGWFRRIFNKLKIPGTY